MSRNLPTTPEPVELQLAADMPGQPGRMVPELGEPGAGSSFDWRRYVSMVLRRKWLVLGVTVFGLAAGVGATRFMSPVYVAHATLWIEADNRRGSSPGPIRPDGLLEAWGWRELVKSYVVLDHVVREALLFVTPQSPADAALFSGFGVKESFRVGQYSLKVAEDGRTFVLTDEDGAEIQRGVVGDSVGPEIGFQWVPPASELRPGRVVKFTVGSPRDAAQALASALDVRMSERAANFMGITLEGTDPERIARTVNAVAERTVAVAAELKRARLDEYTEILRAQLETAEQNLAAAETALESFRVQTITLPSERMVMQVAPGLQQTRDPVFARYFDMKVELDEVARARQGIERVLQEARGGELSVAGLEAIPAVQQSSELRAALADLTQARAQLRGLLHQYTPEHPVARRLMAQIDTLERRTIPQLATVLIGELAAREAELAAQVRGASAELQAIPPRMIEEARLMRQVAIAADLYQSLQAAYEEARLGAESSIPDLRILDMAAVPRRPVRDERPRVILMAFLGSLGLAVLGVVLLEKVDPRVRYPEHVTRELGLPILGAVPRLEAPGGSVDSGSESAAHVIEAFRGMRLNVTYAAGGRTPLLLTVTSPGVGDGKSFVSSNLALAFAEQGKRTLLVDADIRRGVLHRLFGRSRKPGLTDYLAGDVSREAVVQRTRYPMLDLIGSGTRMVRGPELLSTAALGDLLDALRAEYEVIIVDTAPLSAGADPFVCGTVTGRLLMVLRTGMTDRELAGAKLGMLDRLPVEVIGAVLNDVTRSGTYGYYYRLYGYSANYEVVGSEEETATLVAGERRS
ncbi:MAG TPA: polysaccharide biosynthesis tyrosine autokinase [Longimicrobiales bacterium]